MSSNSPDQQAAYDKLDDAIADLVRAFNRDDDTQTDVAVDAVLLVGLQNVDDDGDRVGAVSIFPATDPNPSTSPTASSSAPTSYSANEHPAGLMVPTLRRQRPTQHPAMHPLRLPTTQGG